MLRLDEVRGLTFHAIDAVTGEPYEIRLERIVLSEVEWTAWSASRSCSTTIKMTAIVFDEPSRAEPGEPRKAPIGEQKRIAP